MYLSAISRDEAEEEFEGPSTEFMAGLGMVFTISPAGTEHLRRAEELTVRTHQLNSTGRTFSLEELDQLTRSRIIWCWSRNCATGTEATARSGWLSWR